MVSSPEVKSSIGKNVSNPSDANAARAQWIANLQKLRQNKVDSKGLNKQMGVNAKKQQRAGSGHSSPAASNRGKKKVKTHGTISPGATPGSSQQHQTAAFLKARSLHNADGQHKSSLKKSKGSQVTKNGQKRKTNSKSTGQQRKTTQKSTKKTVSRKSSKNMSPDASATNQRPPPLSLNLIDTLPPLFGNYCDPTAILSLPSLFSPCMSNTPTNQGMSEFYDSLLTPKCMMQFTEGLVPTSATTSPSRYSRFSDIIHTMPSPVLHKSHDTRTEMDGPNRVRNAKEEVPCTINMASPIAQLLRQRRTFHLGEFADTESQRVQELLLASQQKGGNLVKGAAQSYCMASGPSTDGVSGFDIDKELEHFFN